VESELSTCIWRGRSLETSYKSQVSGTPEFLACALLPAVSYHQGSWLLPGPMTHQTWAVWAGARNVTAQCC
jgi:hypothetical protein